MKIRLMHRTVSVSRKASEHGDVQLLNIRSLVKLTSETMRAGMEWTVADVTVVGGL